MIKNLGGEYMAVHSEVLFTLLCLSFFTIKRWGEAFLILKKKPRNDVSLSGSPTALELVLPASLQAS